MRRHLPLEKWQEFRLIERALMKMPGKVSVEVDGKKKTVEMNTYLLTRAAAKTLRLRVGYVLFEGRHHHAVLEGFHDDFVIDLSPIALGGGPILVYLGDGSPWRGKYRPALPPEASRRKMSERWFWPAVQRAEHIFFHSIPAIGSEERAFALA